MGKRKRQEREAQFLLNLAKLPKHQQEQILAKRAAKKPKPQQHNHAASFRAKRNDQMDLAFQSIHYHIQHGLRHVVPYLHNYETCAKRRWVDQPILTMFISEFTRSAPAAYYAKALEMGLIRVNNRSVLPTYIIKDGDVLLHTSHRHEPPVSDRLPVIIHTTPEYVVVHKPAGLVCHPSGAYSANSLIRILNREMPALGKLFVCHRLDRLTSGLMLLAR